MLDGAVIDEVEATTARMIAIDDWILRWYADPRILEGEPDAIPREVAALETLAGKPVPAPRLLAWSPGAPPAVLMSRLPGEPRLGLPDPGSVRAVLEGIHAVAPGPLSAWAYRGYHDGRVLRRPAWWRDHRTWERAVIQTDTARPHAPGVLIHRDFHPGNILWSDDRISGVVDWSNACVGPAAFDAAHFRVNLATLHDAEAADRVISGDPAWDLEAALGFLDWGDDEAALDAWVGPAPHVPPSVGRARLERFVARALAALR
jgi:aminoglycoside phosphotransferase (APT) family kinase protein